MKIYRSYINDSNHLDFYEVKIKIFISSISEIELVDERYIKCRIVLNSGKDYYLSEYITDQEVCIKSEGYDCEVYRY